ncbi:MAG TPA: hypothetical protein VJR06_06105 [Nitrososphaerales archaeon]|nr:hypothetical protein [Nitrososphaerales archaeon]
MSHPDFRFKLILEAAVSPSEDPAKVAGAVGKVIRLGPDAVALGGRRARIAVADRKSLERIRDQLRDRHVRTAARRQLLLNKSGASSSLMLNRQAAAVGVLAVCSVPEESALGPIRLTLTSDRLDEAIDWLTAYPGG